MPNCLVSTSYYTTQNSEKKTSAHAQLTVDIRKRRRVRERRGLRDDGPGNGLDAVGRGGDGGVEKADEVLAVLGVCRELGLVGDVFVAAGG